MAGCEFEGMPLQMLAALQVPCLSYATGLQGGGRVQASHKQLPRQTPDLGSHLLNELEPLH